MVVSNEDTHKGGRLAEGHRIHPVGPRPIGAERFATVSSGASFAQVAEAILGKHARVENHDKDEFVYVAH